MDEVQGPEAKPAAEAGRAYRAVQQRTDALVRGRLDAADQVVPACPEWTVRQTVSHLCGAAEDVTVLNLDGAGTDGWTAAQVDRLAGVGLEELLERWDGLAQQVEELLPHAPDGPANQLVFDAVTHEHDLRGALDAPDNREGDGPLGVALGFLLPAFDATLRTQGLPAVRLTTDLGSWQLGDPAAAPARLALETTAFEVMRAFGGRRSVDQIMSMPWDGDPSPLLSVFEGPAAIRLPATALLE